jgi:hypothetical protein
MPYVAFLFNFFSTGGVRPGGHWIGKMYPFVLASSSFNSERYRDSRILLYTHLQEPI